MCFRRAFALCALLTAAGCAPQHKSGAEAQASPRSPATATCSVYKVGDSFQGEWEPGDGTVKYYVGADSRSVVEGWCKASLKPDDDEPAPVLLETLTGSSTRPTP